MGLGASCREEGAVVVVDYGLSDMAGIVSFSFVEEMLFGVQAAECRVNGNRKKSMMNVTGEETATS